MNNVHAISNIYGFGFGDIAPYEPAQFAHARLLCVVSISRTVYSKAQGFAGLVHDAVSSGQVVLVVETKNEKERICAQEVIQAAVSDYPEIHTD